METNRKILKVEVSLIGVLVVWGYFGVYYLTLEEPVVIEHYIEEEIYFAHQESPRELQVELNYITNVKDDRVVNRVHFPEYPDLEGQALEFGFHGGLTVISNGQQETPGYISGRYSQRTVYLFFLVQVIGIMNLSKLPQQIFISPTAP